MRGINNFKDELHVFNFYKTYGTMTFNFFAMTIKRIVVPGILGTISYSCKFVHSECICQKLPNPKMPQEALKEWESRASSNPLLSIRL